VEILTDVCKVGNTWKETLLAPEEKLTPYNPYQLYRTGTICLNGALSFFGTTFRLHNSSPYMYSSSISENFRRHRAEQSDTYHMCMSEEGSKLAYIQGGQLCVRRRAESYSRAITIAKVNEPHPEWSNLALNRDGSVVAFVSSGGDLIIISITESTQSILLQIRSDDMDIHDGIASIVLCRNRGIEHKRKRRDSIVMGHKLLLLSYNGFIHTRSILNKKNSDDVINKIDIRGIFKSVATMIYHDMNQILIVGGQSIEGRAGIAIWKYHDNGTLVLIYKSGKKISHDDRTTWLSHIYYSIPKYGDLQLIHKVV